ncbi:MAG: signal peptidase II [Deltaproteobacteria bacterium]|nr:signal peptidase II [Deltaproteobacteria bacterium]MBW2446338.1 signal peptidase II [Deltaproteobacteria bacterium]
MTRARFALFATILLFAGGCDHATKQIARDALGGAPVISLAADTVRFQLTENRGGFLSLGASLPAGLRHIFFLGIAPLALLAVAIPVLRARSPSFWPTFALALVAGGGLANWVERLVNDGAVTDFVSLGVGSLRTGIFNLADVFVMAGVAILLLTGFGESSAEPRSEAAAPDGGTPA